MNYKINNSFYIFVTSEIGNWGDKTPDPPIKKDPGDYAKLTCKNAPESAPPGVFKRYIGFLTEGRGNCYPHTHRQKDKEREINKI